MLKKSRRKLRLQIRSCLVFLIEIFTIILKLGVTLYTENKSDRLLLERSIEIMYCRCDGQFFSNQRLSWLRLDFTHVEVRYARINQLYKLNG